jgi:hypothetical protein
MTNSALQDRIREALRHISANDLQVLAEDVACIKYPARFGSRALIRNGRNDEGQTTKNWPDAFVPTGSNTVDGIEATRENQTWTKHLRADLAKAKDPEYFNLSGYFFIGGYPDHFASTADLIDWTDQFAAIGVPRKNIEILIGGKLVLELTAPQFAQVLQRRLGISSTAECFRLVGSTAVIEHGLGLFQPTHQELEDGLVAPPALLPSILEELSSRHCCLVRGVGAAGKTTLAQLVARAPTIAPSPAWYLDVGKFSQPNEPMNDLVELAASGVLFILDNVHLDHSLADQLLQHWRNFASPGSRLLMLGRKTKFSPGNVFSSLKEFELRGGESEMRSVVTRLYRRQGRAAPTLPPEALQEWARIFGGSSDPQKTAVDLIAFTAAVDRKITAFFEGDFRLDASDSVDAMRFRYLLPLQGKPEFKNLLRLASLAAFEIGLRDELLRDPVSAFRVSADDLGIVIEDHTGLQNRRMYKLVHDALGELIVRAAPQFDAPGERILIARVAPAVGLRLLLGPSRPEHAAPIAKAVAESVRTGDWLKHTTDLYEITAVIRYAVGQLNIAAAVLDDQLVQGGALKRILEFVRSLRAVNAFSVWITKLRFDKALTLIGALAADPKSPFNQTLHLSKASEVAILVDKHPQGPAILASINTGRWSKHQAQVPAEAASLAVAAARFFETAFRKALALEPCRRLLAAADPQLWANTNLSHLSRLVRFADSSPGLTRTLIEELTRSGWLERAYRDGALGPLAGGLMSLSNHLPQELRSCLLTPALEDRVRRQLSGNLFAESDKIVARTVCLIGAFSCIGGSIEPAAIRWPKSNLLESLIEGFRHKNDAGLLSMHELEFWLGIRALATYRCVPPSVDSGVGERFLAELSASSPPTKAAAHTQQELLGWLRSCQASNWQLVP